MLTFEDKKLLLNAITLPNIKFMDSIVRILEEYGEALSEKDMQMLTDREKSKKYLKQDYPVLLEVDPSKDKMEQIHKSGNYRYYANKRCVIKGKEYFYTSQLYGYGDATSHGDNRTPLWKWVCDKFDASSEEDAWWPSQEEYPLNLTKKDWKKYILEVELPNYSSPMKMLKGMMLLGGESTCKQLSETYGGHPSAYAGCAMNLGRRVKKHFNLRPCMDGDQERYFPFPFVGKYRGGREDNYLYRIRTELQDALREIDLSDIDPNYERGEEQLSTIEILQHINAYIAAKGFTFDEGFVKNYYLSLKSKPFVILAGTSGTGKTRLVRLFAEAIGATAENGRYKLVSVRPDWSDSSDLFGHANLQGEFKPGAIIDFVKEASKNTDKPYFLCLDEMNLARVEYYLSDFLSLIETRKRNKETGEIVTDEIDLDKAAPAEYSGLYLPENLYVIGTVNMDETTFPFSKKVLDRANTIEFSYVNLNPEFSLDAEEINGIERGNNFLKTEYIILKTDADASDYAYITKICTELQDINRILQEANAHVGYRVRDEIVFYMLNSEKTKLLSYEDALDNEIMQKILPRIQGSGAAIKELLCKLFEKFAGDYSHISQESAWKKMKTYIETDKKNCKYKKSAEKICYMMRRFEEDGFTSYWL